MRRYGRMTPALLGAAGAALAVGLSGAGPLPAGMTAAATAVTAASHVVSAPVAAPASPHACIIGLNCGCIRHRTCPGDRQRTPVRPPEVRLDQDVPVAAGEQGVAPAVIPAPA